MTFIPFGEWLPDQPDFNNPGASTITNVIPLTKGSYGAMPTPAVYSGALTARCQGAYAFLDDTGGARIFAGDATKLYQLTAGSAPSFSDVSRLVGGAYATPSPLNPLIPTAPSWSLTSFGNRIAASNYADAIQSYLVGTSTNFALLSAAAPKARFIATIRDFLVAANTTDATFGTQTRRVWWSAIADPTNWPTPGSATAISLQSDYQDLQQSDLGQITGLIGGHLSAADGAVWLERGIVRVMYVGASGGIFAFQVAEGAAGTQSPLSIVRHRLTTPNGDRAVASYLSPEGFKSFDGMSSVPIGAQKVDRTILADIAPSMISMVQGGRVPNLPLVYWLYCSKAGAGAGLYDRLVLFNTQLLRWALCDISATPAEWGTVALAPGYTLDALDVFGALDTLSAPLDSNYWQGGAPVLAAFDSSHKLNFLTGAAMAPIVETSEFQPIPGRRSKVTETWPIIEGGSDLAPSIAVGHRTRKFDAVTYETAAAVNSIGLCPQRIDDKYIRFRLTLPAGSNFTHLLGVDTGESGVKPSGKR